MKINGTFHCNQNWSEVTIYVAVLWNRNYFLRFRFWFRLLKSFVSGSGSGFWKSYGSGSYFSKVTVPVPAPNLYQKKQIFLKKFVSFLHSKVFYKEKINKFIGSGTVINYGSGSGSDFLTSYGSGSGSGSTRQKVTFPTVPVPVPQGKKLRFLRFRFRFHNPDM
jgi:hypothetical protein